jgi:hypothetical protein
MEIISIRNLFKKKPLISLATIFIPGILFLAIMVIASKTTGVYFETLSRDPIQVLNGKPYIGLISNTGILFWCASAAILLFSSKISSLQKRPEKQTFFLFFSGLLTILMLIDDLFLMHDVIFPDYLKINEIVFYLFYGSSVIAIFLYYQKIILNTDYILLILSFLLLGLSVITDEVQVFGIKVIHPYIVEDSFKFLGIIAWFAYFSRTSYKFVKPSS